MIKSIETSILLITSILVISCKQGKNEISVSVEINYGTDKNTEVLSISKDRNITALEALQYIAEVETHPVDKYVFVTAINDIKAERGKTAWYYKVNGQSPKVLAINNVLNNGDTISWQLKEDVCSRTVDK